MKRKMPIAHIIYMNYLNPSGAGMSIGGIQTYITNLIRVLHDIGYYAVVYQRGDKDFHNVLDESTEIYGFGWPANKIRGLSRMLYQRTKSYINKSEDILIFGCESMIVKDNYGVSSFAVQHGISWDIPQVDLSKVKYIVEYLKKEYHAFQTAQRIKSVDHLVCVDCNFINWYKALVPCPQLKLHYVPNFSVIPDEPFVKPNTNDGVNIIFARRFMPHRGTRLFMKVALRLIAEYQNVRITIAGGGPDENLLKSELGSHSQVKFVKYQSHESMQIHSDKHIAVVPTLGSEGTSLSLLEAMAAGCAVVCTNVGGMTNIVIDGYNGLMISPEEEKLYKTLKLLIENEKLLHQLATRGSETVAVSFSLSKWQNSWKNILKSNK